MYHGDSRRVNTATCAHLTRAAQFNDQAQNHTIPGDCRWIEIRLPQQALALVG